jgi:hypothetical protein
MVTCQSKNIWVNKAWNDIFEKKTSHINLIWYHIVTIVYQIYYFIGSVIDMISCIVYDFLTPTLEHIIIEKVYQPCLYSNNCLRLIESKIPL